MRGVHHAVLHGGGWGQPFGYHYWSHDEGATWRDRNDVYVYDHVVQVEAEAEEAHAQVQKASVHVVEQKLAQLAPSRNLSRRERPHVVLGRDAMPIALSTGVTEASASPPLLVASPSRSVRLTSTPGRPHAGLAVHAGAAAGAGLQRHGHPLPARRLLHAGAGAGTAAKPAVK